MADTEITALQVKNSLDSYVSKMNLLTGDVVTMPQRIDEFLKRFDCQDMIGALGKVEDSFGQAKSLLLQAQQVYQQAEGELKTATDKIDAVDWDSFLKNQQEIRTGYDEINTKIQNNTDKEHSLELLIQAMQEVIAVKATEDELKEQIARVNDLSTKFSNLLFDVQNLNQKLSSSIKEDETHINSLEQTMPTKMNIADCYDKNQANAKFAFKEEIPTLVQLNGVDKNYAQATFAQESDMKKVRVDLFGEDGDNIHLAQKVQDLSLNKADSNAVYSKTAADNQFARKADIVPEPNVRAIVDEELNKNIYDKNGNSLYITKTEADTLIKQDVALEVIAVLRKYNVIIDKTPPLDGATDEEKKELNTGSSST